MSAPNFNRTAPYTLTLVAGEVDRTTWWKDENRREPAGVWWITGPGISRPATDIEISLWLDTMTYSAQRTAIAVRAELQASLDILNRPRPTAKRRK